MKQKKFVVIAALIVLALVCVFSAACTSADGKSAYDLAVEQGFEGTLDEWLASLKGSDGANGRDGVNGAIGVEELYSKAVEEGFDGDYFDFLSSYLSLNYDMQAASNLALLSAVKVVVSDTATDRWGRPTEIKAMGSGVIYSLDKAGGNAYIITNYHVVYNANLSSVGHIYSDIEVFLYGYENQNQAIEAKYIAGAYDYDIAVLKVSDSSILRSSDARAVDVASSKDAAVGSTVMVVGNPSTGSSSDYADIQISVTQGVLSVDSENVTVGDTSIGYTVSTRVMRVDAAINSGNSGGGLYNSRGQLIGIVNAKATSSSIENMGYAIPSDVVVGIVNYAIANCDGEDNRNVSKLYLGIGGVINTSKSVYDSATGTVKLVEEIAVGEIEEGSLAESVLQVGDVLKAVEFDGTKYDITRSFSLPDVLWKAKPTTTTALKFYIARDGADMSVDVNLTADNFAQLR